MSSLVICAFCFIAEIFTKLMSTGQSRDVCDRRVPGQDITGLTRKVAELITLQLVKAREFFVYLANASFFLNFG